MSSVSTSIIPPSIPGMSVADARKVKWVRPYQRPLGELLDEGILTEQDLRWAAQRAYDVQLKEAAAVLLEAEARGVPLTSPAAKEAPVLLPSVILTLKQARSTLWPFGEHKGQLMGELLEAGRLSARDLGFAVDTAYDPRVRQAAMTLLLHRFEQNTAEPLAKGEVHVVSGGRSYMLRRQLELASYLGLIIGALMAIGAMMAILYVSSLSQSRAASVISQSSPITLIMVLLVLLGLGFVVYRGSQWIAERFYRRFERRMNQLRRGQEGEDRVLETLLPSLDGEWAVFCNIELPGQRGDIDVILAGPAGIWVLEVKSYRGQYRAQTEQWQRFAGSRWQDLSKSPGAQAKANAARLSGFLKDKGVQVWVEPVVVWANPDSSLALQNPNPQVWTLDTLRDEAGNLSARTAAKPETIRQTVAVLTAVCEEAARTRAKLLGDI